MYAAWCGSGVGCPHRFKPGWESSQQAPCSTWSSKALTEDAFVPQRPLSRHPWARRWLSVCQWRRFVHPPDITAQRVGARWLFATCRTSATVTSAGPICMTSLVATHQMFQEDADDLQRRKLALKKLLAIRESKVDKQPVLVEDGLFVGMCGDPGGESCTTPFARRWHRRGEQQAGIAAGRHHCHCVRVCRCPCILSQAALLPPRPSVR